MLKLKTPGGSIFLADVINSGAIYILYEVYIKEDYSSGLDGKSVLDVGVGNGDSAIYFVENGARLVWWELSLT